MENSGIIDCPARPDHKKIYQYGYLYYDKGQLTDAPYITNVIVGDLEGYPVIKGQQMVFCYGKVAAGDYLSSYYIKGVGFSCGDFQQGAFAVALEDKHSENIGLLHVRLL